MEPDNAFNVLPKAMQYNYWYDYYLMFTTIVTIVAITTLFSVKKFIIKMISN